MPRRSSRRRGQPLPPGVVSSQRELAQAIGVSPRTVEGWRKGGMPREDDGSYSIAEVLRWKAERDAELEARKSARRQVTESDDVDPTQLNLVNDRNLYFDAKLKEEKLKRLPGQGDAGPARAAAPTRTRGRTTQGAHDSAAPTRAALRGKATSRDSRDPRGSVSHECWMVTPLTQEVRSDHARAVPRAR
jgi:transcriptional regulator with XRE-family HTH domain